MNGEKRLLLAYPGSLETRTGGYLYDRRLALELSILPESERQQVLELFNATEAAYPQDRLIHELFEAQVQRTPQAIAVS